MKLVNLGLVMSLVLLTGCASLSKQAPESINFTGIWRLNVTHSDDPSELFAALGTRKGWSGRALVTGPNGKGAGRVGMGTGKMGDSVDDLRSAELDIDQRIESTRIEYDGKKLEVYRWGEHTKSNRSIISGWKGNSFLLKVDRKGGPELERRFTLSEDGSTLTIVSTANKASITQIYELDGDASFN